MGPCAREWGYGCRQMKRKFSWPVIDGRVPLGIRLTMDEHKEFVEDYLRTSFDREAYERRNQLEAVDVRFRLRPADTKK